MGFRCKRYRIVEVARRVKTFTGYVDSVFVVQRRRFVFLWLRQYIPVGYFDFPYGWVKVSFVFYHVEDAAAALCAWLWSTHKPDDYTIYITLPDDE